MDITASSFQRQLPSILDAVAEAHFVTIDLELSGIPGHQGNKSRAADGGSNGKPSLQQRYEENKTAAEKYQVLQLGITCVGENKDRGVYVLRPYNIFVNPLTDGKLDVDRTFSFQSGALEFLLGHGFRMDAPFMEGVSYFSREEESIARNIASARQSKTHMVDIGINSDDVESLEFLERARSEIDAWHSRADPKPAFLNIAPIGHSSPRFQDRGLNNFQKRLVHQLVRAEYPGFVTIGRPGFIQIVAFDKEQEEKLQNSRTASFEGRLKRQIGLRWLVEAMVGGDLATIETYNLEYSESDTPSQKHEGLFDRLQMKKTILVGHNVFIDLIYFYACFFGQLPEKVEDFECRMHELFPRIIDTKYLATHGINNPAISRSSLDELDEELSNLTPAPVIEMHQDHKRYIHEKPAHEAGFDSYLTAKVVICLSAKLEAAGQYVDQKIDNGSEEEANKTTPGNVGSSSLTTFVFPSEPQPTGKKKNPESSDSAFEAVPPSTTTTMPPDPSSSKRKRPPASLAAGRTPFSHATKFDVLGDLQSDDDLASPSLPQTRGKARASEVALPRAPMMPPFDSDFWNVYGNKLRVNGTAEGICRLDADSWAESAV